MEKISYYDMIKEAIVALKERAGSSTIAIKRYLAKAHPKQTVEQVQ